MLYFDTDVLTHYCFEQQDPIKHQQSCQLIRQTITDGLFCISTHSINELAYVLAKLKMKREVIQERLADFCVLNPAAVTVDHIKRAAQIAYKVSFHHMSDCLHTAVAEEFCTELFTYNRSDFQLIEHHTKLKITVL